MRPVHQQTSSSSFSCLKHLTVSVLHFDHDSGIYDQRRYKADGTHWNEGDGLQGTYVKEELVSVFSCEVL